MPLKSTAGMAGGRLGMRPICISWAVRNSCSSWCVSARSERRAWPVETTSASSPSPLPARNQGRFQKGGSTRKGWTAGVGPTLSMRSRARTWSAYARSFGGRTCRYRLSVQGDQSAASGVAPPTKVGLPSSVARNLLGPGTMPYWSTGPDPPLAWLPST
ncbi:MAG: hypothetical protein AB1505_31180 [Candidatus Latescibacterota bacterium]